MEWTDTEKRILAEAIAKEMKPIPHMYPTAMSGAEYEAFKRAEREHAPNVAVRMNPNTFRMEYYNTVTGEIVSSHI